MKKLRSIITMLLIAAMILPVNSTYAANAEQEEEKNEFSFIETEDKGFKTTYLLKEETYGQYNMSCITSQKSSALDGLEVCFDTSEFGEGNFDSISVLWTEKPLGDEENHILYAADSYLSIGPELRYYLIRGGRGLGMTVKNLNCNEAGRLIAREVSIVYYDGSYKDRSGNPGIEYSFPTKDEHRDDIEYLNMDFPEQTVYEEIDITDGLIFSVAKDDSLGFVVNINGKDYGDIGSELYPYWAVDLYGLSDIETGYTTAGAVVYSEGEDKTKSLTVESVNGECAAEWMEYVQPIDPVTCNHDFEIDPDVPDHLPMEYYSCFPPKKYVCYKCGTAYYEPGKSHGKHRWITIKDRTFDTGGTQAFLCLECGDRGATLPLWKYPLDIYNQPSGFYYNDTNKNAWYSYNVYLCRELGYMKATSGNRFEPNSVVTREQFAVILLRVSARTGQIDADREYSDCPLKDVAKDKWYTEAVCWAVEEGYMQGIGNNTFGVGKAMDRASAITVLFRHAQKRLWGGPSGSADLSSYIDYDKVPEWSKDAMSWAVSNEIIIGTDKNTAELSPEMVLTRAQAAQIIINYRTKDC